MTESLLGIFLDITILICLGVSIFYAFRLSKSLSNFKSYREEFLKLIQDVSSSITDAQNAVESLKAASQQSGAHLQDLIDDSTQLADELQLMNEAGNNLAKRLEGLAERNRRIAQGLEEDDGEVEEFYAKGYERDGGGLEKEPSQTQSQEDPPPSFFIQDRDIDEAEDEGGGEEKAFASKAEQELYDALQKNKKTG